MQKLLSHYEAFDRHAWLDYQYSHHICDWNFNYKQEVYFFY